MKNFLKKFSIISDCFFRSRLINLEILLFFTIIFVCSFYNAALAQSDMDNLPIRSSVDDNGVNLPYAWIQFSSTDISIGNESEGLSYTRTWLKGSWKNNYFVTLNLWVPDNKAWVNIGTESNPFTLYNGNYTSDKGDGSTLVPITDGYLYTGADGTKITLDTSYGDSSYEGGGVVALGRQIDRPGGLRITLSYKKQIVSGIGSAVRLQSVQNSSGYMIKFSYNSDFRTLSSATAINLGIDYCDAVADICNNMTQNWPSAIYSYSELGNQHYLQTVMEPSGSLKKFIIYKDWPTSWVGRLMVSEIGSFKTEYSYKYVNPIYFPQYIKTAYGTWAYDWSKNPNGGYTININDPLSNLKVIKTNSSAYVVTYVKDELGNISQFLYDNKGRLVYEVPPEGAIVDGMPTKGYTNYLYDSRGNVTCSMRVSKIAATAQNCALPSTVDKIVTTATYPSNCTDQITCNKPTATTDALGRTTNIAYDSVTGLPVSVTQPAPSGTGTRPQVRYGYSNLYAYYKQTTAGLPIQAPTAIAKLTSTSTCVSIASCAGSADEIMTSIGYGPQVTGTPNNLLPVTTTSGSGDGLLAATATTVYDMVGNPYTVQGPLGAASITRFRYDAGRRLTGLVGPDPDGAGPLKYRAQKLTYNNNGQITVAESGTVESQSDADWANFVTLQQLTTTYDAATTRRTKDVLTAPTTATAYQVMQYSYDALGRVECQATRMNAATWGSLPSSACTLSATGIAGPDRIARTIYDAMGRVSVLQTAYGVTTSNGFPVTVQRNEASYSYTDNGMMATLIDAKNNKTTYEYDGFDRLTKTRYPSPTTAGSSSTTDYEQPTYDANSNVTALRLRDAQVIAFAYDNLNRLTFKNLPGAEPDVTYGYDLLGRMTSASQPGSSLTFGYDALGRLTFGGQSFGSMAYKYDLAGRRTRATWNDGFYVTYDWDLTNAVTAIRENGAASGIGVLATYVYDNLGNRTGVTRGNGTSTSYGFDPASRLTALTQNLSGTAADQTLGLSYSGAGQIISRSSSNDAFAFTQQYNANRAYSANGLNQYVAAGGSTPVYDARGNMTAAGATSYSYSAENRLKSTSGGVSLYYDPIGRLHEYDTSVSTRFMHDGGQIVAEVANPSGAIQRRYVFGPGADEALMWYEGAGTSDRRWLHADERGSIIAASDGSGNLIGVNAYDEWGNPQSGNIGRFGYTGQAWLAEAGLWYYKARMYNPRLGRFMQTDPIGYGDGMNLYAYVGNDPVNLADPSGLQDCPAGVLCAETEVPGLGGGHGGGTYGNIYGPSPSQQDFGGRSLLQHALKNSRIPSNLSGAYPAKGIVEPQNPKKAPCFSIQDRRVNHDKYVAQEAERLSAAGYQVATEVSMFVYTPQGNVMARADIVARIPGSKYYVIHEIKTGNAGLSKNQSVVYNANLGIIAGNNGLPVGLKAGDFLPLENFTLNRCPGLGSE